jgi:hypothetical protein
MKVKFFYKRYHSPANELRGEIFNTALFGQLIGAPEKITAGYQSYLLSALSSDFNENRFGACDHVLSEIERIERGEIDEYMYEGQGFMHIICREGVTFEHMIFGVCPEWPLWTCPLPHYKAVLKGFRKFVKMPESINSELIIELPELNEKVSAD